MKKHPPRSPSCSTPTVNAPFLPSPMSSMIGRNIAPGSRTWRHAAYDSVRYNFTRPEPFVRKCTAPTSSSLSTVRVRTSPPTHHSNHSNHSNHPLQSSYTPQSTTHTPTNPAYPLNPKTTQTKRLLSPPPPPPPPLLKPSYFQIVVVEIPVYFIRDGSRCYGHDAAVSLRNDWHVCRVVCTLRGCGGGRRDLCMEILVGGLTRVGWRCGALEGICSCEDVKWDGEGGLVVVRGVASRMKPAHPG